MGWGVYVTPRYGLDDAYLIVLECELLQLEENQPIRFR